MPSLIIAYTFLSQKRTTGLPFDKQSEKKKPQLEDFSKLDPNIPTEEFRNKDGKVLKLEPTDPGNLKKGMQSLGNVTNYRKMDNQINPRKDGKEKDSYLFELEKELGLPNNPNPSQPGVILEKNDRNILKPKTPGVTTMNEKGTVNKAIEEKILEKELLKELDFQDRKKENNLILSPKLDEGNTKGSKNPANNTGETRGGQKNVTSMQQKGKRFGEDLYNEAELNKEINKEYNVDGIANLKTKDAKDEGNILILGPPINPKYSTQKNSQNSTFKKQSGNELYHEKNIIEKELKRDEEELIINETPSVPPRTQVPTTQVSRFRTSQENKILKDLDNEIREEVILDSKKVHQNELVRTSVPGVSSMKSKDEGPNAFARKSGKEDILVQGMINQTSEKELNKSLNANKNLLSQGEVILNDVGKSQKRVSTPSGFRNSSNRIESSFEKDEKQKFLRNTTEELILNPSASEKNVQASNKNAASLGNKQSRIPNKDEEMINKQLNNEFKEELMINVGNDNDKGTKKSLGNASSMKSLTNKTKTVSELDAEKGFNNSMAEKNLNRSREPSAQVFKANPSASSLMKGTDNKAKTVSEKNAEKDFTNTLDEANVERKIVKSPPAEKSATNAGSGTLKATNKSDKSNKSSASELSKKFTTAKSASIPSKKEASNPTTVKGKEKGGETPKIETPKIAPPTIAGKAPVPKESFDLEQKFNELNI